MFESQKKRDDMWGLTGEGGMREEQRWEVP